MTATLDQVIAQKIAAFQAKNPRQQTLSFTPQPAYVERRIVEQPTRAPAAPRHDPLPDRLRDLADGLQKDIDHKLDDRRLSNAPKRQREAMSARIDGRQLQRVQQALRALADARDAGNLPPILEGLKTKSAIAPLVRKSTCSNGYYHVGETGEYSDNSPLAVALRNLMDGQQTAEQQQAQAEQAKQHKIREMENDIRFAKIDGFFPTPPELIGRMLELAQIEPGMKVLEPSAGKGDIAEALEAEGASVVCCERNYNLIEILCAKGLVANRGDFMEQQAIPNYDRVVMNPPFEHGQDADHVRHAFTFLKPGGRLVAIVSNGLFFRQDKKAHGFREWLSVHNAYVEDNDPEAFKNGFVQTGVATKTICVERQ